MGEPPPVGLGSADCDPFQATCTRVCDGFVTVAGKPIDPKASILDFGSNAPSIRGRNDQIRYVSWLSVDRYGDRSPETPKLGRFLKMVIFWLRTPNHPASVFLCSSVV